MGFIKRVILEKIPAARDRQKYGKSTFTEAGEFAENIRLARDLLGKATSFSKVSVLNRNVLVRTLLILTSDLGPLGQTGYGPFI